MFDSQVKLLNKPSNMSETLTKLIFTLIWCHRDTWIRSSFKMIPISLL